MSALREEFIRFAVDCGVLRFGEFVTKAGRTSPYFFNAGLFNDGQSLGRLADYYADTLLQLKHPEQEEQCFWQDFWQPCVRYSRIL